jgi:hypothetical protein
LRRTAVAAPACSSSSPSVATFDSGTYRNEILPSNAVGIGQVGVLVANHLHNERGCSTRSPPEMRLALDVARQTATGWAAWYATAMDEHVSQRTDGTQRGSAKLHAWAANVTPTESPLRRRVNDAADGECPGSGGAVSEDLPS